MTPILTREHRWICLACDHKEVSYEPVSQARISKMHACPGTNLLSVPLFPEGTRGKVVVLEREDYIGSELVQTDARGRPVMAVNTVRDEGQDATVYASCAVINAKELT